MKIRVTNVSELRAVSFSIRTETMRQIEILMDSFKQSLHTKCKTMLTVCFRVVWNNWARTHRSHEPRRPLKRRGQTTTSWSWCRAGSRSTRWSERKRKRSQCRVDGQRDIRASAAGMSVLWARVAGQPRAGRGGGGGDAVRTVLQLWH